jgi:hypothetical protein
MRASEHGNIWARLVRDADTHPVNGWGYRLCIELVQTELVLFGQQPLERSVAQDDAVGLSRAKYGPLATDFVDDFHRRILRRVL